MAKFIGKLFCILNRHHPSRRTNWDGRHYTGTCEHCGSAIRRKARGKWRREWLSTLALGSIIGLHAHSSHHLMVNSWLSDAVAPLISSQTEVDPDSRA